MDQEKELEEYSQTKLSPRRRRARRMIRYFFVFLILAVNVLIWWRVLFSDRIPGDLKKLTLTPALTEAYARDGAVDMFLQNHEEIIWEGKTRGYFWVPRALFIRNAGEVQLLIRYNNSTLSHIAEDFSLPSPPSRDSDVVDVTLVVRQSVTTEREGETLSEIIETRLQPSADVLHARKNMYNYRKFVFDGIDFDKVTEIVVQFYYRGAVDYNAAPYGELLIYDNRPDTLSRDVALSRSEERALAAAVNEK